MPMSINEFASKIKDKYPEYGSVPNDQLVKKIIEKHPEYKSQVSFDVQETPAAKSGGIDLGGAAMSLLKAPANLFIGGAKGVGSTIAGAASLGEKALNKASETFFPNLGIKGSDGTFGQSLQDNQLKAQGVAQNIGKTGEQIGEFFLPGPGGKLKPLTKGAGFIKVAINLGGRSLLEGTEQFARSALQRGDTTGGGTDFAIGAAMPPGAKLLTGGLKLGGNVAKGLSSKLSGVPVKAIEQAMEKPAEVKQAIRSFAKNIENGPQRILDTAEEAFNEVKQARSAEYRNALENVTSNFKTLADPGKVKETFVKPLKQFGFDLANDGTVSFGKKVLLPKSQQGDIKEVIARMNEWDDFSPLGINDLRKVVESYEKNALAGSTADRQFNAILSKISHGLNEYTSTLSPEIKKMNEAYAKGSQLLDEASKAISLGKDKPTVAMRKLLNMLNAKSDVYKPVLDKLSQATGKDLATDVAGYSMAKVLPEGLTSNIGAGLSVLGSALTPASLLPALASSPRLVGEVSTALGSLKNNKALRKGVKALSPLIKGAASQLNR